MIKTCQIKSLKYHPKNSKILRESWFLIFSWFYGQSQVYEQSDQVPWKPDFWLVTANNDLKWLSMRVIKINIVLKMTIHVTNMYKNCDVTVWII